APAQPVGATPEAPKPVLASCSRPVFPGRHRIMVERAGYKPVSRVVSVSRKKSRRVEIHLEELPSPLEIKTTPTGAAITVNSQPPGAKVAAGQHELAVTAGGCFVPHRSTFTAREGKPVTLRPALTERIAVEAVTADSTTGRRTALDGIEVAIDGNSVSLDKGTIELPPGQAAHRLRVRKKGHIPRTVDIPVERPASCALTIELKPEPALSHNRWPISKKVAVAGSAGVALASWGTAAVLAVTAHRYQVQAREHCGPANNVTVPCKVEGVNLNQMARMQAEQSNILFAVGTVAAMGSVWSLNLSERPSKTARMSLQRKLSLGLVAGSAAAGIAVATAYRLRSGGHSNQAQEPCAEDPDCEGRREAFESLAAADARLSNLAFVAAGVAAAGGLTLWLMAPDTRPRKSSRVSGPKNINLVPTIGADRAGAMIFGEF
ncbi:MAG: hypothetical protein AAGC55_27535, partial [Myxococcota bacterium]